MEESAFMKKVVVLVAGVSSSRGQHDRDSAELRRLCGDRDKLKSSLADMTAECDDLRKQVESMGSMSLAEAVVSELRDCDAENYKESTIEITFDDGSESVNAVVTLQRIGKPTAHMLRLEAEAERDELLAALKAMCSEFRGHDLPHGSSAYLAAVETINKSRSKAK